MSSIVIKHLNFEQVDKVTTFLKKFNIMFERIEEEDGNPIEEYGLTEGHKKILDERLEEHKKFPNRGISLEQAEISIRNKYGI